MEISAPETLYRRLQEHLDRNFVGFPATRSGVEIRILRQLFTPEEAEIALELSAIPEPVATIHKRFGARLTPAELEERLETMDRKGVIRGSLARQERRYSKLPFVVGMYERQVKTLTAELERDARQYLAEELGEAFHTQKTTQMRVAVNQKIAVERFVTNYDEMRAYIGSSPGPFAVIPCVCRRGKSLLGGSCRQTQERDNCLMVGPAAEWATSYAIGKQISREEMLALLDQADREGLVLEPENTKAPLFICCCCGCCCNVLTSAKRFPAPADYFSSNYYAEVDQEACQSCGTCQGRCQMDAISNPEGRAVVDRGRCIGCGLCVTTCPSGALRLKAKAQPRVPPDDTRALYFQMLQERYGALGLARAGAKKALGMKV